MKAAQINEYGDASVIHVNEVPTPVPGVGQVLVEVHATSLNPFDSKIRSGMMQSVIPLKFPAILGGDIAGIVTATSSDVSSLAVGDSVYGSANVIAGNSGAFAEFAGVKISQLAKIPANISFVEVASLPLVGISALQALTKHINLQPDQKLFIHGGAGGIGMIAIQIAKHIGAYVITTATGESIDLVRNLGADEVIDYKTQGFAEAVSGVDAVFDTVGGSDFTRLLTTLKPGGIAVSMGGPADDAKAKELGITAITQGTQITTEALDALRTLVESGIVTPLIGGVFPLDQVKDAFEAREHGGVRGKIVLTVK